MEEKHKKGQYIDTMGYARFTSSDELVHRYVTEKYILGRKLLPNEEIYN